MKNSINLQDQLLNQARKEKIFLTIFLVNGVQIKGTIKGVDNYVILLDSDGKQNIVYKHAVSTIIPAKVLTFKVGDEE